jgi:hypothetical protein
MITICTNIELIARYVRHEDHDTRLEAARDVVEQIQRHIAVEHDCQIDSEFRNWQGGRYSRGGCPLVHWSEPGEAVLAKQVDDAVTAEIAAALAREVAIEAEGAQ